MRICLVCIENRRWGHLDDFRSDDGVVQSCRGCALFPGPLQSVQRAELRRVILALQAFCAPSSWGG